VDPDEGGRERRRWVDAKVRGVIDVRAISYRGTNSGSSLTERGWSNSEVTLAFISPQRVLAITHAPARMNTCGVCMPNSSVDTEHVSWHVPSLIYAKLEKQFNAVARCKKRFRINYLVNFYYYIRKHYTRTILFIDQWKNGESIKNYRNIKIMWNSFKIEKYLMSPCTIFTLFIVCWSFYIFLNWHIYPSSSRRRRL